MQENKLPCHTKVIQSDIILVFVNSVFWNFQPHYLRHKLLSVFISLGLFSLAAWVLYRKVFLVRQKRLWDKVKNSRDIIAKFWEQKKKCCNTACNIANIYLLEIFRQINNDSTILCCHITVCNLRYPAIHWKTKNQYMTLGICPSILFVPICYQTAKSVPFWILFCQWFYLSWERSKIIFKINMKIIYFVSLYWL